MAVEHHRVAGWLVVVLLGLASCGDPQQVREAGAVGVNARVGDVLLRNVYVAAPRGSGYQAGQNAVVQLRLVNEGRSRERLAAVSSPMSRTVEIRWDPECDGSAEPVAELPLRSTGGLSPGRESLAAPFGAYHLRMVGLREEVLAGDSVPVEFDFGHRGRITVDVVVEPPGAGWATATPVCRPLPP